MQIILHIDFMLAVHSGSVSLSLVGIGHPGVEARGVKQFWVLLPWVRFRSTIFHNTPPIILIRISKMNMVFMHAK